MTSISVTSSSFVPGSPVAETSGIASRRVSRALLASGECEEVKETGVLFSSGTSEDGHEDASAEPYRIFQSTRECDCPEWVVRCVHFGERWLINHGHPQIPSEGSTWVCSGTGTGPAQDIGQHAAHQLFATEADALAAFYAAERELLERAE